LFAKITKGSGLRGALEYDFAPAKNGEPRAEFVCGPLCGTPRQMARQAAPLRELRQVANPIWRVALSADPKDGVISVSQWDALAHDFLKGMGLVDPSQAAWCAVRHTDRNHDHLHITVVRVLKNGQLFSIQNDAFKAKKVTAELEQKYQLATHSRERAERRAPSISETSAKKRNGKMSSKEQIQSLVDLILEEAGGEIEFNELQKRLAEKGIDLKDSVTQKGRLQGFNYLDRATGVAVSGSKLGADYSLGLLTRGVKYTPPNAPKADEKELPAEPKRSIPPAQRAAEQVTYSVPAKTWTFDGKNAIESGSMSSPFSMVAAAAMELAAKLIAVGIKMWRAILEWLGRKLGLAGLGMTSNEATRSVQIAPQPSYIDTTSRFVPDPLLIEQTASEINAVREAVAQNDSNLLPESAQHLAEYFEKEDSTEQVEADPFAFMPHGDQLHEEHEQAASPASPFSLFLVAKTKHAQAQMTLKKAMDSDEGGGVDDIWGGREVRDEKVKELRAATAKLAAIKSESKAWEDHSFVNKMAGKIGGNPHDAPEAQAQTKVAKLAAELKAIGPEKPRHTHHEVSLIVAAQADEKQTAEATHRAKIELISVAKATLDSVAKNAPLLIISLQKAGHDEAKIRDALNAIKNEVEAARRGQNPGPVDDEAARLLSELADAPKV
jgi:Relaxase/Mobilisation nuclease domain